MAPYGTMAASRKRLFDNGKSAILKSRKNLLVGVAILLTVFLVLRFNFPDPKDLTDTVSSSVLWTSTDTSLDDTVKPIRDSSISDPVAVDEVTLEKGTSAPGEESVKESAPVNDARDLGEDASEVENDAVRENDISADDVPRGEPGKCLKHVLYDKPVKTGSTAITFAIREFLETMGESDRACGAEGPFSCVERAKSVCNGTTEEEDYFSILGHLRFGGRELADCLRPKYYVVTSVREPYQRRKSAYLWNRTLNGTHFKIPHTASFKEFMNQMPRCQLYHYYDGRGWDCDIGMSLEDRIQDIVDRVDEVIDIYDEPAGPLHRLIAGYLRRENESIKIDEKDYVEEFDRETLEEEQMLYDRLRAKRLQRPKEDRLLC